MNTVTVNDLVKSYPAADGSTRVVLDRITFSAKKGSVVALVGPNGCGKTTLLSAIAGLNTPDSGSILVGGKAPRSAHIGFVWQNYRASLLPWLTVSENIAFPLRLNGVSRLERAAAIKDFAKDAGVLLPLTQRIYNLSGGQQQSTALLRALVIKPDVLLLDEPTSALDIQAKWNIFAQVESLRQRHNLTTIWVSHDPDEAVLAADVVLLMSANGGRIVDTIYNPLPRPRVLEMLTDAEHLRCRQRVLDFILHQKVTATATTV